MIEVNGLRKVYGATVAVDGATFVARPGRVTGFLGPNGAGKSTTMRLILGLERPEAGAVRLNGQTPGRMRAPLREVGALLEGRAAMPGVTARTHLRSLAATHAIPTRRVNEVLELTGLASVAGKRIKTFSMGMGQRLGVATALLGDPRTLVLDEPINGLDPDGVIWVRELLRHQASRGVCVLLSSHLMSEMSLVADDLVLIGRGRVLASGPMAELVAQGKQAPVQVRADRGAELADAVRRHGGQAQAGPDGAWHVLGLDARGVGQIAAAEQIPLTELRTVETTLEQAYLDLTAGVTEFASRPAHPQESSR